MERNKYKILNIFYSGSKRTRIIKKNIVGSFFIKGLSLIVNLAIVPVTINLLNQEKYGIWITVYTITSWFNLMDIGIGNGFRNKFAESFALNNKELAKEYLQTFYSSMLLIAIAFFLFFSTTNIFLDWNLILNLPSDFDENINLIIWVVFGLFCVQLVTKNISVIYLSLQKTSYNNFLIFLGNLLALVFILTLKIFDSVSLFTIAIAFMLAPIIVFVVATENFFKGKLKNLKPVLFSLPKKKYLYDLIGLGLKFFVVQIAAIFMYGSGNIIITQLFEPSAVTPYNVSFRLYSSVQVIFSIIITPFWSAFTEANSKNDNLWIIRSMKVLIKTWLLFSVFVLGIWVISPVIFKIWVGEEVIISSTLSLQFAFFVIINTCLTIFITYLSGISKTSIMFYVSILQCLLYIPLSIFLAKILNLGTVGIIVSLNINLLVALLLLSIQSVKTLNNNARGIWNK